MAETRIEIRGDLTDITEKFAQLRGQIQALDGQAAAPVSALTERFKSMGAVLAGVGTAMAAVGGSFAAFGIAAAKGAGQTAEQLDNLRQKTGLTTDELRQLTPIFNRFNTDLNALVASRERPRLPRLEKDTLRRNYAVPRRYRVRLAAAGRSP